MSLLLLQVPGGIVTFLPLYFLLLGVVVASRVMRVLGLQSCRWAFNSDTSNFDACRACSLPPPRTPGWPTSTWLAWCVCASLVLYGAVCPAVQWGDWGST
eukprot:507553-Alexandrium_andersonii.AAC.1